MPGRLIAIGDIHGCADALEAILERIAPQPEDRIVTLGDYVDRGPETPRVVDRLIELQEQGKLVPLLGNHELMMLVGMEEPSELQFWLSNGGAQTLAAYGDSTDDIPPHHLTFLRGCQRFHETESHFFVHANYVPNLPLTKQSEFVLFWEHLTVHFPAPHQSGKIAVVGHTPQRHGEVLRREHLICLDTNCCGGGYLSAMDLGSNEIWQVRADGSPR